MSKASHTRHKIKNDDKSGRCRSKELHMDGGFILLFVLEQRHQDVDRRSTAINAEEKYGIRHVSNT